MIDLQWIWKMRQGKIVQTSIHAPIYTIVDSIAHAHFKIHVVLSWRQAVV